jgi:hypothetical protein
MRVERVVGLWRDGPALHGHHGNIYIPQGPAVTSSGAGPALSRDHGQLDSHPKQAIRN